MGGGLTLPVAPQISPLSLGARNIPIPTFEFTFKFGWLRAKPPVFDLCVIGRLCA
jgi:hypothetical protein